MFHLRVLFSGAAPDCSRSLLPEKGGDYETKQCPDIEPPEFDFGPPHP
jgi:hypothetical protein